MCDFWFDEKLFNFDSDVKKTLINADLVYCFSSLQKVNCNVFIMFSSTNHVLKYILI